MKNLKLLRENKGYSKSQVSKYLGVTPETVGYIERVNRIKYKYAIVLADLYSTPLEVLYDICEIRI